ncbi:hypothetical protein JTB14_017471 [Gonioctena quinquepunctata]|nr:hypothetical protein JTB14_017471 [Gonioctena quinquepunctata]
MLVMEAFQGKWESCRKSSRTWTLYNSSTGQIFYFNRKKTTYHHHFTAPELVAKLEWAQEFQNWDANEWATVLFTDESRFGFHPDFHQTIGWRRPVNAERLRHVQKMHTYRGGTLMVWGGITICGRTDLVFHKVFSELSNICMIFFNPLCVPLRELLVGTCI